MTMIERKFKAVNRKAGDVTTAVIKEGADGNGVILPYHCGFCRLPDRIVDGVVVSGVQAAFRTQRERNRHTNRCPN